MKGCLVLFALLAVALAADKYPSKYDNLDVDSILNNNRLLTNYINCMLEKGSCTKEGQELKKILPDALATSCSKCNEKQKTVAEKVINHLQKHRSTDWERLLKKYDPQGAYEKRYEEMQAAKKH
ncbi:hypothetical protein KM043_010294 [Ampulex compressa]|nr:hypothetical protein KM043_010294 [Ampulex compressa]